MYDDWTEAQDASLVGEPRQPLAPFLWDGEDLFEVVDWHPERPPRGPVEVRRLSAREQRDVRRALLDAAQEAYYLLPARRRPRRR